MSIFDIREYNQDESVDELYTNKTFPIFTDFDLLKKYLRSNYVYGKVLEYDVEEFNEYFVNGTNIYEDVPEPLNEWVTDDLIDNLGGNR